MSAASGAGKTTLKDLVIKDFPDIKYSISATTRKPREGEVDGVHYFFKTKEEFEKIFAERSGFVKAMWCGETECEEKIKEDMAVTSRCMPFEQKCLSDKCVYCNKPAKKMVYWGRAY